VLDALAEPIRRRSAYVARVAHSRGVAQPTAARDRYNPAEWTQAEWTHWYENNPLTEKDFTACLDEWKSDVQLEEKTLAKIAKEGAEGSRAYKEKLRECMRSAFKVEVKDSCPNYQLALGLLQHPPGSIHTLLDYWRKYMISSGYQEEKERSRKLKAGENAAVLQKAARTEVKKKLDELRHKKRQVEALKRKPRAKWTPEQTVDVAYYDSGDLTKHLDELTKQHGYGKMHNTDSETGYGYGYEFLKPASWDLDRGDVHPAANSSISFGDFRDAHHSEPQ
jgi:hypothetical protein